MVRRDTRREAVLRLKPECPSGISIIEFPPTDKINLTAAERNYQSGLQSWVLRQATERASFASRENLKAPNWPSLERFPRHSSLFLLRASGERLFVRLLRVNARQN
jgi:hypothetical protein